MGTISTLSSFLQSDLSSIPPSPGVPANAAGNATGSTSTPTVATQMDNQQLSPFAQMLSELQQLQQTNPTKYQQVTGQIAANLQEAAQTFQADGNSAVANQLNQLAADFTSASQSGQLPNLQDLAQATGGHRHHHHHHSESASTDPSSTSSTNGTSTDAWTSGSNQSQDPLLSSYQANGSQSGSFDPATLILNTLSSAGVSSSSS